MEKLGQSEESDAGDSVFLNGSVAVTDVGNEAVPEPISNLFSGATGILFDTNIFNRILDKRIDSLNIMQRLNVYVVESQWGELENTKEADRRERLLQEYFLTAPKILNRDCDFWQLAWEPDIRVLREQIKTALDLKKRMPSNAVDAEIAAVCIRNGLVLCSEDRALRAILIQDFSFKKVIRFDELVEYFRLSEGRTL